MQEEDLLKILVDVFTQITMEFISILPRILITLVVLIITFIVIRALNTFLGKALRLARVDDAFGRFSGFLLPFSLEKLIIILADLGIILTAFYVIANLFLEPHYMQLVNDGIYYGARVISIIVVTLVIFAIFNAVLIRVKVDPRIRTYPLIILMLLVTAMLIDITALSSEIKGALAMGLSIGVGIAIGAFAVWFFFHEYLDIKLRIVTKDEKDEKHQ